MRCVIIFTGLSEEFLSELKSRADIVDVVSKYCQLEKKGRSYWACCPFHREKTPSFSVNAELQFYNCFGCHEHGDVIKFVEKMENIPFFDAVKILASGCGMQMPEGSDENQKHIQEEKKHKQRLLDLLKQTAIYYNKNLNGEKATPALEYMKSRSLSQGLATRFGLGYSLDFYSVISFLKSKGFSEQEMFDAGVIKKRDEQGKFYDAMGGRLVFPLINIYGEVVAFCGRILEKDAKFAKYINTAETKIFTKGKNLYGINLLKRKNATEQINNMIIVEGQMDVVSLHSAGFGQAVASMGTALTLDQAKLIKRFVNDVYICYDGDSAGKKATIRGLEILKEQNLNVLVMSLPEGLDPDDVIKKQGRDAFQKLMDEALPLTEFKLAYLKKLYGVETKEGKTKFIESALDVLRELSDVEKEVYVEYVAENADVNKDFLKRQLFSVNGEKEAETEKNKTPKIEIVKQPATATTSAKRFVLASLAHRKPYAVINQEIEASLEEDEFKQIFEYIYSKNANAVFNIMELYDTFPDNAEVGEIINYVFENIDEKELGKYYKDCLKILKSEYLNHRQEYLTEKLKTEQDGSERKLILIELGDIAKKLKEG